jgi:hypothetical protein
MNWRNTSARLESSTGDRDKGSIRDQVEHIAGGKRIVSEALVKRCRVASLEALPEVYFGFQLGWYPEQLAADAPGMFHGFPARLPPVLRSRHMLVPVLWRL